MIERQVIVVGFQEVYILLDKKVKSLPRTNQYSSYFTGRLVLGMIVFLEGLIIDHSKLNK